MLDSSLIEASAEEIVKRFASQLECARKYLSDQKESLLFVQEQQKMFDSHRLVWNETAEAYMPANRLFDHLMILERKGKEARAEIRVAQKNYDQAFASWVDLMSIVMDTSKIDFTSPQRKVKLHLAHKESRLAKAGFSFHCLAFCLLSIIK